MCIRDRLFTHGLSEEAYGEVNFMARGIYHANIINTVSPTSVSYTHLRAHETVLDLVCRLLLEKKNKKTKIQHKTT